MPSDASSPKAGGLYGAIWRWHFYAGLFVVPFVVLLAVTGAIYLFDEEIETRWYADLMQVSPAASPRPLAEQQQAVLAQFPGAEITGIQLAKAPTLAAEWSVKTANGIARDVFVDPGRAVVTGSLESGWRLMNVVSGLHGSLLAGQVGDWLIELAASWAFVLIVTGLYLWWPRDSGVLGALVPRLTAKGRVFWRDLHAVPAFWNALFVAFLILSGLPWAGFWGDQLVRLGRAAPVVASSSPHFNGALVPSSQLPGEADRAAAQAEAHHHGEDHELSWGVRNTPPPLSGEGTRPLSLDRIEALLHEHDLWLPGARIGFPTTDRGVLKLGHLPDKIQGDRMLYVDQYSGEVLQEVTWREFSPVFKAVEWGVAVHLGRQFGLVNQIVGALSCLLIVLTAVTGTVMWWKRRPAGKLGAPSLPKSYRTTATVALITLALGAFFPLMGASLIAVLLIDLIARRLQSRRFAR